MPNRNPSKKQEELQQMGDAFATHPVLKKVKSVDFEGGSLTPQQVSQTMGEGATACEDVNTARTNLTQKVKDRKAKLAEVNPVYEKVKAWVKLNFASNEGVMKACGLSTSAPAKPSLKTRAAAVEKGQATRAQKKGGGTPATPAK